MLYTGDGRCLEDFEGHVGPVMGLAVAPQRGCVVSCGKDHTAKLWGAKYPPDPIPKVVGFDTLQKSLQSSKTRRSTSL